MKNLLLILFATLSIFVSSNSYAQELNPGDGVRITFLDIKDDISGDYFIQSNGFIQLPFIGIVNTTNRDYKEIKDQIEGKVKFINDGNPALLSQLIHDEVVFLLHQDFFEKSITTAVDKKICAMKAKKKLCYNESAAE